jgi:hypothetical protein
MDVALYEAAPSALRILLECPATDEKYSNFHRVPSSSDDLFVIGYAEHHHAIDLAAAFRKDRKDSARPIRPSSRVNIVGAFAEDVDLAGSLPRSQSSLRFIFAPVGLRECRRMRDSLFLRGIVSVAAPPGWLAWQAHPPRLRGAADLDPRVDCHYRSPLSIMSIVPMILSATGSPRE